MHFDEYWLSTVTGDRHMPDDEKRDVHTAMTEADIQTLEGNLKIAQDLIGRLINAGFETQRRLMVAEEALSICAATKSPAALGYFKQYPTMMEQEIDS